MMKLMTMKQYMNMSKPALIRKITKALRVMPKAKLARLCYNITKSKLPRLSIRERKKASRILAEQRHQILPSGRRIRLSTGELELLRKNLVRKGSARMNLKRLKPKRKFSRKQLAAQRLFAKRARAGTLRR